MLAQNRVRWDECLGEAVYSYNTAVQESTGYTPFEAMFGRLLIDLNISKSDPDKKKNFLVV